MRFSRHRSAAWSPSRWNGRYYSICVPALEPSRRPSRDTWAPSLPLPALVLFWYWNWRRRWPCLAAHRTWQRRYLRAAMPRPWLAAFRGELVRPALLCGRATRALSHPCGVVNYCVRRTLRKLRACRLPRHGRCLTGPGQIGLASAVTWQSVDIYDVPRYAINVEITRLF